MTSEEHEQPLNLIGHWVTRVELADAVGRAPPRTTGLIKVRCLVDSNSPTVRFEPVVSDWVLHCATMGYIQKRFERIDAKLEGECFVYDLPPGTRPPPRTWTPRSIANAYADDIRLMIHMGWVIADGVEVIP